MRRCGPSGRANCVAGPDSSIEVTLSGASGGPSLRVRGRFRAKGALAGETDVKKGKLRACPCFLDDLDSKLAQLRQARDLGEDPQWVHGLGRFVYTRLNGSPEEDGGESEPDSDQTQLEL